MLLTARLSTKIMQRGTIPSFCTHLSDKNGKARTQERTKRASPRIHALLSLLITIAASFTIKI
jgi:hypothetical protein